MSLISAPLPFERIKMLWNGARMRERGSIKRKLCSKRSGKVRKLEEKTEKHEQYRTGSILSERLSEGKQDVSHNGAGEVRAHREEASGQFVRTFLCGRWLWDRLR